MQLFWESFSLIYTSPEERRLKISVRVRVTLAIDILKPYDVSIVAL